MTLCRELWKRVELIEMPFGLWTRVGPSKHVLGGVHTGATWRIPLNCPCAAAMQPFCEITLTTCCYCDIIKIVMSGINFDWSDNSPSKIQLATISNCSSGVSAVAFPVKLDRSMQCPSIDGPVPARHVKHVSLI